MGNIDFSKSKQYTLSIRLSADGFSFTIHHPQSEDINFITYPTNPSYSMTANIKKMLAVTEELKYTYQTINILVDTPRFTLVPFDIFEDEQTETFFHLNFPPKENETILCNILGKSNVAILFGMDKHAHQLLAEQMPNARIYACASPLLEYFTPKSRDEKKRILFAHIHSNKMEILAFDKGKLLITNSFSCKQTSDKVYYLLYIWQQLGFNQAKDHLWLAGYTDSQEELITELTRFIRKIKPCPPKELIPYEIQTLIACE